jgi:hypothetical protein
VGVERAEPSVIERDEELHCQWQTPGRGDGRSNGETITPISVTQLSSIAVFRCIAAVQHGRSIYTAPSHGTLELQVCSLARV